MVEIILLKAVLIQWLLNWGSTTYVSKMNISPTEAK